MTYYDLSDFDISINSENIRHVLYTYALIIIFATIGLIFSSFRLATIITSAIAVTAYIIRKENPKQIREQR